MADKVRDLTAMSILIAGKQPIQSIITLRVVMDFLWVWGSVFFDEGLDFGEGDGFDDVGECHCQ